MRCGITIKADQIDHSVSVEVSYAVAERSIAFGFTTIDSDAINAFPLGKALVWLALSTRDCDNLMIRASESRYEPGPDVTRCSNDSNSHRENLRIAAACSILVPT